MSWDVMVQDLPAVDTIEDIPPDYQPKSLGTQDELIARLLHVFPEIDFRDSSWGRLGTPTFSIEFNMSDGHFMMHVRGGDEAVDAVTKILVALGVRGMDSEGNILPNNDALASFRAWRGCRDRAIDE